MHRCRIETRHRDVQNLIRMTKKVTNACKLHVLHEVLHARNFHLIRILNIKINLKIQCNLIKVNKIRNGCKLQVQINNTQNTRTKYFITKSLI